MRPGLKQVEMKGDIGHRWVEFLWKVTWSHSFIHKKNDINHILVNVPIISLWKHQKTKCFLVFLAGIKLQHRFKKEGGQLIGGITRGENACKAYKLRQFGTNNYKFHLLCNDFIFGCNILLLQVIHDINAEVHD